MIGADTDPAVVNTVNRGLSHVGGEPGLDDLVRDAVTAGRLRATVDTTAATRDADVIVVIVPVKVYEDGRVDFSSIDHVTAEVGRGLRPGVLVIYETTLPVGTTRNRLARELAEASGLAAGRDFAVAFSPERVYSGRVFRDLRRYPKIVGGIDAASGCAAEAFYRVALEFDAELPEPRVWVVGTVEAAEFTKLVETTYRDVNIALANQFARFADAWQIDVDEVVSAANSQPFSHVHRPGVGVGGHCIPVYPLFLLNDDRAGESQSLARMARLENDDMADYGVQRIDRALGGLAGQSVLILGYSYRENVREDYLSTTKRLVPALSERGARVLVHDPHYSAAELIERGVAPYDLTRPEPVDGIVLQALHREYRDLDFRMFPRCRVVLDGRNAIDPATVESAGLAYIGIGRGNGSNHPRLRGSL